LIKGILQGNLLDGVDSKIVTDIQEKILQIEDSPFGTGADFLELDNLCIDYLPEWYLDNRLNGVLNHASRSHMDSDIHRYLFVSCFGN
ncbi:hypothetical protein NYZ53_20025, partial [Acinetobacter baumannii]|nr:hypothetical protein [Acinetobacter baumannii]